MCHDWKNVSLCVNLQKPVPKFFSPYTNHSFCIKGICLRELK